MGSPDKNTSGLHAKELHVFGRVQGVGFRPFAYRLAVEKGLKGSVYNRPDGVIIHIEGPEQTCAGFADQLREKAPSAALIKQIRIRDVPVENSRDFQIMKSGRSKEVIAEVCPDISVCDDCLREMYSPDRRAAYPFINCTNCGPRFSIIEDFPYDRQHTSMAEFNMCPDCYSEYHDPRNRRFHAQPVSCFSCGPRYEYILNSESESDISRILKVVSSQIDTGKLVALKGLGGYNLVCDAINEKAVRELRNFKKRERKPLAVMFRSIDLLKQYIEISSKEENALCSWRKPIVILGGKQLKPLATEITMGLHSLGAFLPYIPLQYLLFDKLKTDAIVLTSGNKTDTPILYREEDALSTFSEISGGVVINDRKIARRMDDSVVRIICDRPLLMRRSRSYSPAPIDLEFSAEGILATGAELSNAFCLGKGTQAIFSQHIGDLKNHETLEFFEENIKKFSHIYRFIPKHVVCDLHPDYLSTRHAHSLGLPLTQVQHHHAHIAAVMAEHGISEPVIGLAYDGTGFGTDGNIWGSEVMIADYHKFSRMSHFEYIPLPGGDLVTREPWRTGLSYMHLVFGKNWNEQDIPFTRQVDLRKAGLLTQAINKNINAPLSCSAGRLFDAVAAITGVCLYSNYHAEAPQLMENYLDDSMDEVYPFTTGEVVSYSPMIREIVQQLREKAPLNEIITKFHNTLAHAALSQVKAASKEMKIKKVILSGGTFQNKYLTEKLVHLLLENKYDVFLPNEVSCNDGGIALGQLAIAAAEREGLEVGS